MSPFCVNVYKRAREPEKLENNSSAKGPPLKKLKTTINDLPPEISQKILSSLSLREINTASEVDNNFFGVAKDNFFYSRALLSFIYEQAFVLAKGLTGEEKNEALYRLVESLLAQKKRVQAVQISQEIDTSSIYQSKAVCDIAVFETTQRIESTLTLDQINESPSSEFESEKLLYKIESLIKIAYVLSKQNPKAATPILEGILSLKAFDKVALEYKLLIIKIQARIHWREFEGIAESKFTDLSLSIALCEIAEIQFALVRSPPIEEEDFLRLIPGNQKAIEKARHYFDQAIEIARAIKNDTLKIEVLLEIIKSLRKIDKPLAVKIFSEIFKIYELGDNAQSALNILIASCEMLEEEEVKDIFLKIFKSTSFDLHSLYSIARMLPREVDPIISQALITALGDAEINDSMSLSTKPMWTFSIRAHLNPELTLKEIHSVSNPGFRKHILFNLISSLAKSDTRKAIKVTHQNLKENFEKALAFAEILKHSFKSPNRT